jgi:hypothetical protein
MNLSNILPIRVLLGLALLTLLGAWAYGIGPALAFTLLIIGLATVRTRWVRAAARRVVGDYVFPGFLRGKLREHYPDLGDAALRDVERGLRQFFLASAHADGRFVAMPSKVVDALWHEFILYTRGYESFCRRAFGRLLHHTPAEAMPTTVGRANPQFSGLRRAWYWSCREEGIDPRRPDRLPLLFALDTMLAIPGGYRYAPDCRLLGGQRGDTHCATGFGCGSSCGGSGCGGSSGDGGCGGGCGGD